MSWRVAPIKMNKLRAVNLADNDIGKKRHKLYKGAFAQAKLAIENGFYIEVIAISESIIADRLEARRAFLAKQDPSKRGFRTLGTLLDALAKDDDQADDALIKAYKKIQAWEPKRNFAVHELVKLREDLLEDDWDSRYLALKIAAEEGLKAARAVSTAVTRSNKH